MNIISRITYFLDDFAPYLILSVVILIAFIFAVFKIYKSKRQNKQSFSTNKQSFSSNKQKKLLISISALVLSLVLIFVAAEAYFRYVYDVSDGLGFLKVNKKWVERHVVHNNYFYRDRDFQQTKDELTLRIGVLGDSITWGGGIENPDERFSNILENRLNEAGYQVEVYNLGRPGYDSQQEIEEFEKVRHLNFDILIWEYFINDIQPSIKSTGTRIIETNRDLPAYITFFTNKSYFLDFLYWRLTPTHQKTFRQLWAADIAQYENEEVLNAHKSRITDFIKSFDGTNTKILFVIFPSMLLLGPDYPAAHVHQLMTEIIKEQNLQVLDLLPDFADMNREELMASKFDPHPNEYVHQLVADRLFEALRLQLDNN